MTAASFVHYMIAGEAANERYYQQSLALRWELLALELAWTTLQARPPPEASRKRKMEMEENFVEAHWPQTRPQSGSVPHLSDLKVDLQVDFQPGEFPMGLVAPT